jgi:hypothetical protein
VAVQHRGLRQLGAVRLSNGGASSRPRLPALTFHRAHRGLGTHAARGSRSRALRRSRALQRPRPWAVRVHMPYPGQAGTIQATTTTPRPFRTLRRTGTSPGPDRVLLRVKFPGSARRPSVAAFRRHASGGRTTHPIDGKDLASPQTTPPSQRGRVVGPPARPKPLRRSEGPDCAVRRQSVRRQTPDQKVAGLRAAFGEAGHSKRDGPRSLAAAADKLKSCAIRAASDCQLPTCERSWT